MNRRSFLPVVAAFLAGCGQLPSTDTSPTTQPTGTATTSPPGTPAASPTETPTETATETPTETATETPTETATETPDLTEREQRAAELLTRAVGELNQAVIDYADSEDGTLLDVSAADSVVRASVLGELSDAREHLQDAQRLASNRQQARVNAVEDAHQFISLCLDTQTALINAYGELQQGREEFQQESEQRMGNAIDGIRDEQRRVEQRLSTIREETTAENVEVVPRIPAEDYDAKVAQFSAEQDGFTSLANFLERLQEAVVDLNNAQRYDRVESENQARESAQQAAEAFETLTTEIREFAADLSESGASLVSVSNELADIAETKAAEAREIEADNS